MTAATSRFNVPDVPVGLEHRTSKRPARRSWCRRTQVRGFGLPVLAERVQSGAEAEGQDARLVYSTRSETEPTAKELHRFEGHDGQVHTIAYSPDNRYLLSGDGDASTDDGGVV